MCELTDPTRCHCCTLKGTQCRNPPQNGHLCTLHYQRQCQLLGVDRSRTQHPPSPPTQHPPPPRAQHPPSPRTQHPPSPHTQPPTTKEIPSFGGLDQYTIGHVAEFLPTRELIRFSKTSKAYRQLSTEILERRHQAWRLKPIQELGHVPIEITFVAVSDEGQLITVSEKNGVDVWDREGHSQHLMDLPMEAKIRAFSSDGELIAYELPSGGNYILDRSTHKQTKISLDLDLQAWNRDAFSFDHRLFVGTTSTGGLDKKVIKVLRLSDGAIIKQFTIDYGHGASVSLSPDNNLLAYYITRAENTLHLVDLSTGQSKEIRVPDLRSINFSHDGRLLAMGTRSSIILYDVTDHQNPQYIQTILTRNTMWLAFSPDDTFLVASVYTKGVLMLGPLSDSR